MRSQPVEFLEFVEGDLYNAYEYYDSWLAGGSSWFRQQFRETVAWIEWNPEMFPIKHRLFRRAIVRRSYFGVFFAIEREVTTVVAVRDMRGDPREIQMLLRSRKRG